MGLDISYNVDNDEEVFDFDYITNDILQERHALSRTFANLISRKSVISDDDETEPKQISKITGVNLSEIEFLDEIPNLEEIEEIMEFDPEYAESQKQDYEEQFAKIQNNIKDISLTLSNLLSALNEKEELSKILKPTSFDSLNNNLYFSKNISDRDNFYKDLTNFKDFVEYAKSKGSKTIWFKYM